MAAGNPSETYSGTSPKLAGWDETGFSNLVGGLIASYRAAEIGGGFADSPGKCAELKFTPASDTLKLKKGQTGTIWSVRVESNGTADNPRATAAKSAFNRTGQENATVTPGQAQGNVVPFNYTVTKAGAGVKVKATFKATSTAGLAAEASWTQPTDAEAPVKRITGTFSGSADIPEFGNFDWHGTITFARDSPDDPGAAGGYTFSSAAFDLTASGTSGPPVNNCKISGSKHFDLGSGYGNGHRHRQWAGG